MSNPQDQITQWLASDEVLVFGHRGAKAYAPMNTIPAFELAAEQGADGIELDIHLSKDGIPFILHDATLDATTDQTGEIANYTSDEINTFDAGSWFDTRFTSTRIPTLDKLFDYFGDRFIYNVELKSYGMDENGMEQAVLDVIQQHNLAHRILISSFNPIVIQRFRQLDASIPVAFLQATETLSLSSMIQHHEYEAWHPSVEIALNHEGAWSHPMVNVWTVNDPDIARQLVAKGVTGLISDAPDQIRAAIT